MNAAIYVRVSTDRQARDGLSLQAQERACRDFATEHGFDVAPEHLYIEAHSASEDYRERPALGNLLEVARLGALDAVIFFDPDRMTRKRAHRWILDETFNEIGVTRHFVTSNYDDTLEGQLLSDIHAYVAEKEIEKKRTQIRNSYRERLLGGKLLMQGSDMYGYRRNPDTGTRDVHEPEAIIVRRIFRRYLEGHSTQRLARDLNSDGVPSPAAAKFTYRDGHTPRWAHHTISNILRRSEYAGRTYGWKTKSRGTNRGTEPRPEDEWIEIPGVTPAIIDEAEWDAVQLRLNDSSPAYANTRNHQGPNQALLRGLIVCAKCGLPLNVDNSHGRMIYRCSSREKSGGRCGASYVRADMIEPWVWGRVSETLMNPDLIAEVVEQHTDKAEASPYNADLDRISKALAANRRAQERHLRRLRILDDPDVEALVFRDLSALRSDEQTLETENEYITRRIAQEAAALEHVNQLTNYVQRVAGNLQSFDFDERRMTLEALGIEVVAMGSNTSRSPACWDVRAIIPIAGIPATSESRSVQNSSGNTFTISLGRVEVADMAAD